MLRKQREVLHQIKQAVSITGAAQHNFQRHAAGLVFALNALPLEEPSPVCRERANATIGAITGDQQGIEPEELRNLLLVMREVLIKSSPCRDARLLKLNYYPRQAIHKAYQIRATGIKTADHAELTHQQKVIVLRALPIHHAQAFGLLSSVLAVWYGNRDAFFE